MGLTAAVVGASGYAGGELLRLLAAHPQLQPGPLQAAGSAGRALAEVHPQLASLAGRRLEPADPAAAAAADVVFLALPHGESARFAAGLPAGARVVDLAADHRGGGPGPGWPYGLPELPGRRAVLAGSERVANPGCYATAMVLALAPLLAAGLAEPDDVVVVAASGTSGAGRTPAAHLLATEVAGDLHAYRVGGGHAHVAEVERALGATVSFTPVLAPMPRGILATCTARVGAGTDTETVRGCLAAAYAEETFVRVLPAGAWPHTAATLGSNTAHLQAAVDRHAGRVVVVVALDNLGKGAAGQAVQNANLLLGLPEAAGLPVDGVAP